MNAAVATHAHGWFIACTWYTVSPKRKFIALRFGLSFWVWCLQNAVQSQKCVIKLNDTFWVSDRPTCLTFCCNKMSKNAEWINSENLFFHPSRLMCSLSMLQCYLYCDSNVSANRMQSDESWLSKAMLRCSLTSPKAMSVQTECKTWKLVFESFAEVQPDFAVGKDTTCTTRNPIFFAAWYRTSKILHALKWALSPLFMGFPTHFPIEKKNKIGI